MKRDMTTPGAIVIGSIVIALGLYFGLREKNEPADWPAASAGAGERRPVGGDPGEPAGASRGPAPQAGGPAPAQPSPPSPPAMAPGGMGFGMPAIPPELRAKVEAQATKALEEQRPTFLKSCWEPAVKASPTPAKSKYTFNMTFDGATGKELSRGISETRGESRGDVGQCLRGLPIGLTIEPPGTNVNIDISINLP